MVINNYIDFYKIYFNILSFQIIYFLLKKNILINLQWYKFNTIFIFFELFIKFFVYITTPNLFESYPNYIISTISYILAGIILFFILLPSLYYIFISSNPIYLLLYYLYYSFYYFILYINQNGIQNNLKIIY